MEESGNSSIPLWEEKCRLDGFSAEEYKDLLVRIRVVNLLFSQISSMPIGELTMLLSISRIAEENGDARVSSLHNALKSSKPAVSRMLHTLEKKGYVEMKNSEKDQRYVMVRVTDVGREMLQKEMSDGYLLMKKVGERMGRESMEEYFRSASLFYKILAEEVMNGHHRQNKAEEHEEGIT